MHGLTSVDWPAADALTALAHERKVLSGAGRPLQFTGLDGEPAPRAADYEIRIHDTGRVPLRPCNWHDFFNAAAWLTFPRAKAALNRGHVEELRSQPACTRSRRRDALTLFDESGVLVISRSPVVLDAIRDFAWQRVFWEQRELLMATTRFVIFGHALYEKALSPYVGMTGHALLLAADDASDDDTRVAGALQKGVRSPGDLAPLPVLGVPGWWDANRDVSFYRNTSYFRGGRRRTPKQDDQVVRLDVDA